MAKKTYRTFYLKGLQILIHADNGRTVEVSFRRGVQIDSTAKFTTSEEWLQNKLESLDGFNKTFYIESVQADPVEEVAPAVEAPVEEKKEEAPKAELTDVKDVKRFHNIVEMRAAMAELGFENVQSMNYVQLKSAASKQGYDFQIQK